MGVTTNTDAVRDIIPSTVLNYLSLTRFILGSSSERMDRVIEAVLVKQCACLSLGHEVANFLRNYFLMHDGTLISFIRALKVREQILSNSVVLYRCCYFILGKMLIYMFKSNNCFLDGKLSAFCLTFAQLYVYWVNGKKVLSGEVMLEEF